MKTSLLLATVLWSSLSAAPSNSFNAVIKGRERQSVAGATGLATFKVEDAAIRYEVKLASLKQVTDVVLLTGTKAIRLYGGGTSERETFEAGGVLTESNLEGLTVSQVQSAMESGKAEVVVFTVKLPDGSISGKVVAQPDAPETPAAPEPKVTASTS